MNLSMKWLSEFTPADMPVKAFADAMNIVVGKILSIEKHPDADKLVVCQVDVGEDAPLQIVTGATNLKQGDLVPVAKDHSVLADGTKIKKGKLRGVLSCGMLCSQQIRSRVRGRGLKMAFLSCRKIAASARILKARSAWTI